MYIPEQYTFYFDLIHHHSFPAFDQESKHAISPVDQRRSRALSQSVAVVGFQICGRPPNAMQQSAIDTLLQTSPDTRRGAASDQRNVAVVAPSARQLHRDSSLSTDEPDAGMYRCFVYHFRNKTFRVHA